MSEYFGPMTAGTYIDDDIRKERLETDHSDYSPNFRKFWFSKSESVLMQSSRLGSYNWELSNFDRRG